METLVKFVTSIFGGAAVAVVGWGAKMLATPSLSGLQSAFIWRMSVYGGYSGLTSRSGSGEYLTGLYCGSRRRYDYRSFISAYNLGL
jgi:hypothetical protein